MTTLSSMLNTLRLRVLRTVRLERVSTREVSLTTLSLRSVTRLRNSLTRESWEI